jgi:hypothetical protein
MENRHQLIYEYGSVSGRIVNAYMICPHAKAKTITGPYGTWIPCFSEYELYVPCSPLRKDEVRSLLHSLDSPDKHLLRNDPTSGPLLPEDGKTARNGARERRMPPTRTLADEGHLRVRAQGQPSRAPPVERGRCAGGRIGYHSGELHFLLVVVVIEHGRHNARTGFDCRNEDRQSVDQKFVQCRERSCVNENR